MRARVLRRPDARAIAEVVVGGRGEVTVVGARLRWTVRAARFGLVCSVTCAVGEGTVEGCRHGREGEGDRARREGKGEARGGGEAVEDCDEGEEGGGGDGDEDGF